nr:unnamed protein product [Callosobruchus analis]
MIDWRLFCIVLSAIAVCEGASEYVGTACSNSGRAGTCKLVTDCPPAVETLRRKHSHDFKRCDWDDKTEVICCPSLTNRNPDDEDGDSDIYKKKHPNNANRQKSFSKRKCEQACEEYKKRASCVHFNIVRGENALQDEFPHMAALGFNENGRMNWDCGASIISNKFLLSAAHCFVIKGIPTKVRLGVLKITSSADDLDIKTYKIHDEYDYNTKHNDIALVEVDQKIEFSDKVRPACLYWNNDDPEDEMWIIGWGKSTIDQEDDRTVVLQKARVSAVSVNECNSTYRDRTMHTRTIRASQICAIGNSSDACGQGDSGGPLQVENGNSCSFSIVGVISYGMGCGGVVPGVYTRVSRYIDWIEQNVWP